MMHSALLFSLCSPLVALPVCPSVRLRLPFFSVGGDGADTDSSDDEADDQAADDLPGLESASDWESESEAEWEHDCESMDTDAMTDVDE